MSAGLSLVVYLILLGALAIGSVFRPPVALAGAICIFGLKQWGQSSYPWLAQHAPFTNFAVGFMILTALTVRSARGECVLCKLPRTIWLVFALYSYALISLLWTPRLDLALPVWQHDYPYMITIALLAPLVVKDRRDFLTALEWTLVIGGALAVLLLLFGNWGMRGLLISSGMTEDETNPLALAGLAGTVASIAIFIQGRWFLTKNWIVRLAIVGACLLVIVKSGSRGQLVAALSAIAFSLPLGFQITRIRASIPILAAVAVIGVATTYGIAEYNESHIYDVGSRWSQEGAVSDATGRLAMISALLNQWSRSGAAIVFGVGNSAAFDPTIIGIYPHNIAFETLGEEGLIGFGIYLALIYTVFSSLVRAWVIVRDDPDSRRLVAAVGSSFLFFFLISQKEGNLIGSVFLFMYASLSCIVLSSVTASKTNEVETPVSFSHELKLFPNLMN